MLSNLTQNQRLLWLGQRLNPTLPLYNMIHAYHIDGAIDPAVFETAFNHVVAQSDTMRTVIVLDQDGPKQAILPAVTNSTEYLDFSVEQDPKATYNLWIEERKKGVFDLEKQLWESVLIKLDAESSIWYFSQHHLTTDAISIGLVYQQTSKYYDLVLEGNLNQAAPLPQYATFINWEQEHRQTNKFKTAAAHWQDKIDHSSDLLSFYGKSLSNKMMPATRLQLPLGAERSAKLRQIAQEDGFASLSQDMSLFSVFATALSTTLHRITGQDEIRVGTPYHGRPSATFKNTIGLFIEMGVLDVSFSGDESFADIGEQILGETFTNMMQVQPGISSSELNNSYNVVVNYVNGTSGKFAGHTVKTDWIQSGYIDAHHAFRFQITDFDQTGNYICYFDLATAIFGPTESEWLLEQFLAVLDTLIADSNRPVHAFTLLNREDHQNLFIDFNDTDQPYPKERTVIDLFADQVQNQPDAIAAVRNNQSLTYSQLDQRSTALAHQLIELGAKPEEIIAICMERSLEVIVAIWGVLKTGAAYVPIDPAYPAERQKMMLADAEPLAVLVNSGDLKGLVEPNTASPVLEIDATSEPVGAAIDQLVAIQPSSLAYMVYTSGSTGKPKGTMLTHQGLMNYVCWAQKVYQQGEVFDFPLYSSLAFDLTITSVFVPTISGGKVVIYSEADHGRGLEIVSVIQDDAVDLVKLTPAHLDLVLEHLPNTARIKALIVGGEDFKTELANKVVEAFGREVAVYNEYGPTEAVVGCMIHRFDPEQDRLLSVPIGTPADNARIYVLDPHRQPVPRGVVGEMFISSDGVARGYRNRPDLTAERFSDDPFRENSRMYQTGDMAKWGPDGRLVFLGRRDDQVKIRGARIELGEVESALLEHPDISSVVIDVVQKEVTKRDHSDIEHCSVCGLPSNYPTADFDDAKVCSDCHAYAKYQTEVERYFRTPPELVQTLNEVKAAHVEKQYDSIVLLSGGKDSTYMLYQLVREFGLRPLAFTLDNGFISPEALKNVEKACTDLGVDLKVASTPHMNAIFADSLQRKSNVCDGCFKTIYTLSMSLARSLGISTIVTGLARGQLFETRLADTFKMRLFDPEKIDNMIIDARKAYHHIDDAVYQLLDTDLFQDDRVFGEITFVDFYRYVDVDLNTVYDYLTNKTIWERPSDTGRSTNCLINDVGIYIHQKERGFHNYALPYSWDVRLGHKHREAAMDELDDALDVENIRKILDEIGYDENAKLEEQGQKRISVWYTADNDLNLADLRIWLSDKIPDYMLPSYYTQIEAIPLTTNGKVDRRALPDPTDSAINLTTEFVPATTELEIEIHKIFQDLLDYPDIGINHDFFDLGGDSVIAIQTISRINDLYDFEFPIPRFFDSPTILGLSIVIEEILMAEIDDLDEEEILRLLAEE